MTEWSPVIMAPRDNETSDCRSDKDLEFKLLINIFIPFRLFIKKDTLAALTTVRSSPHMIYIFSFHLVKSTYLTRAHLVASTAAQLLKNKQNNNNCKIQF